MKLIQFYVQHELHLGIQNDKGVIDLWDETPEADLPRTMREALEMGLEETLARLAPVEAGAKTFLDPESLRFAPVVDDPEKILCIGTNYKAHILESGLADSMTASPNVFAKFRNTLVGHGGKVLRNPASQKHDYEAEIAIVIGKTVSHASREEALDAIFGYTLANDISARDLQNAASQWVPGKTCDTFCPLGPCILTRDAVAYDEMEIRGFKNGEQRQIGHSSDMLYDIPAIVAHLSQICTLVPGDVILTGTPSGVIMGRPEGQQDWLVPGDRLDVTVPQIGTLTVTVADA